MFFCNISTTYQKIGDLFCPVHISGLSHSVISLPFLIILFIIEIAEDLENEIFHIDHYNKELFNMIQPSVHPSKKPGYCKYCKFCKYW